MLRVIYQNANLNKIQPEGLLWQGCTAMLILFMIVLAPETVASGDFMRRQWCMHGASLRVLKTDMPLDFHLETSL